MKMIRKKRAPGDLFEVRVKFNINLSEYDVDNSLIGNKVTEKIELCINKVGSNK